jgi:hypothetical protein
MTDEDIKPDTEANPDVLESGFEESIIEEEEITEFLFPDENDTTPDIAFQANDEDYW